MNFWEFEEDHLFGYYLPHTSSYADQRGKFELGSLFFLSASVLKLIWALLLFIGTLLYILGASYLQAK